MMPPRRLVQRPTPGLDALPRDMHPLLRRVYAGRSVACADEVSYSLDRLLSWELLGGAARAAEVLAACIRNGERILVCGDYDVDGATACALAVRGLKALGAADVEYLVPDRARHGYGLSPAIVELAGARAPRAIVTVDNGISSLAGAERARALGIALVITDHHLPGPELPAAAAIVNPNLEGDPFPSKCLSGVGVMFYLLIALRAHLREAGWFARRGVREPPLSALLDLVALGTVADVVPLDFNNRILVSEGLARIRAGRCAPGITALLRVARRDPASAQAADLAYAVAPRLNAAGRLEDMRLGIECLLADDPGEAARIAERLDALNRERREIQEGMHLEALAKLPADLGEGGRAAFCLFEESWHPGVVGVLAARIKDCVHRPVFAFAREPDGCLKGSGRSVDGVHLRDALAAIATRHPALIRTFGGHAMAAGMTLEPGNLELFAQLFEAEIAQRLPGEGAVLYTDGPLEPGDFSVPTALMLREAGPWGCNFPEPLFEGEFDVLGARVVGSSHLKFEVVAPAGRAPLEAIAFNAAAAGPAPLPARAHLAYRLDVNEFRGRRRLQLVVEHMGSAQ